MVETKTNEFVTKRRDVLKTLTGLTAVAATTAVATVPAEAQTRETRDERRKARYQANSKHVQDFYRTNRY
ncbi:MAG: twin-arginine translocation signal domain-containing protein [Alphaproteobacteria bacterium]|jgi:hypothetical protein